MIRLCHIAACRYLPCRIVAAISCLLSVSCAMLRTQTIQGVKTVWLSRTDDDASLNKLMLLNKGKLTDTDSFVRIERGVQVYIAEQTAKRCKGKRRIRKGADRRRR